MSNIHGKQYAMNAISPMKPWKTWIVRVFFFYLGRFPSAGGDLVNLSFIHFARWIIVRRDEFPQIGSEISRSRLRYDYLIFFSNFNGTWNQYIDAFSAVLSKGLNFIWRWSEKFPGAVPVTPFKQYILRGQFWTDYYYTAYPHATTNDVKAAHRVVAALDDLEAQSGKSAAEFETAYRRFLLAVQTDLGSTGEAPVGT